jgi:hypothetical protein
MRTLLIAAVMIGSAIPNGLHAQRGGARGGAIVRPGGLPAAGRLGGGSGFGRGFGGRSVGFGWGYSGFYPDNGWPGTYADDYQAPPSVVLVLPVQPPPEPPTPPPPPQPARPVMHEYAWPDGGGNPNATFSLVSKTGLVHRAVAVWVQDSEVRYTSADGGAGHIQPAAIDCGASERLNAQNKLRLGLPGCPR